MIRPSVTCQIQSSKSTDLYGQEKLAKPRQALCSVVRLVVSREKTSVRADSSASRGKIDEIVSTSRLLFLPTTKINLGDKVEIADITLKVDSKNIRFSVNGRVDHVQVDLVAWA
ncbi:MAG: hypothetical protein HRT93_03095 [Piscirickettsiaceae bacterium]|nr:hypothetical protein [Piscirickettsiaceae bacterium]